MSDLILPLKREYFEAIRDGSKTEEYRLCTKFWRTRISMPAEPFPPRIMKLLVEVADRECKGSRGPWQDGDGEPLQDDADAAIAWINLATPHTEPLSDAEIDGIYREVWSTVVHTKRLSAFARAIERAVLGRGGEQ